MYTDPTFEARAINTNLPVGTLGGEGTVTSSGGVTYNIPIVLPPGTNGAMPSLGLNYNSGNNNGQLGLGWSLSGLSTIMRDIHRKSFENDLHEVAMDNGDAFTLDGEHLKPIQGNNGENGTVYDTYNTAFSKITSYTSNNNNGPEWFEVVTKDNLILEYGKTTSSRFLTQEGGVYANKSVMWQLNKVTDPYGNYTEYIYAQNNNTDREPRIIEIRYTGNAAQGLQPYNKVLFEYGDRQDHNSLFMPGVELTTNSVITKITVINEGSPMRIYELAYSYDINTTFLSEITETALGAETMEHFNSTIFKYGNPTTNHYEVNSSGLPSLLSNSANRHDMILDFNGDGYSDFVSLGYRNDDFMGSSIRRVYENFNIFLRNPVTNTFDSYLYNQGVGNFDPPYDPVRGWTGTLTSQLPYAVPTSAYNLFANFVGAGISYAISGKPYANGCNTFDFNGDGKDDILFYNMTNQSIGNMQFYWGGNAPPTVPNPFYSMDIPHKLQVNTTYTGQSLFGPNGDINKANPYYKPFIVGDFNGDGAKDILGFTVDDNSVNFPTGDPNLWVSPIANAWVTWVGAPTRYWNVPGAEIENSIDWVDCRNAQYVGDFNGDGIDEVLIANRRGELKVYQLNWNGNSVSASLLFETNPFGQRDDEIKLGDFNGDGKTDIFLNNHIGYCNGRGFIWKYIAEIGTNPTLADVNGDGKTDILYNDCNSIRELELPLSFPNFLYTITNTASSYILYSKGVGVERATLGTNTTVLQHQTSFIGGSCNPPLNVNGDFMGDFNADGKIDFLNMSTRNITTFNAPNHRLLEDVKNGMNVVTSFDYERISHPNMNILSNPSGLNYMPHNYGFYLPFRQVYAGFSQRVAIGMTKSNGLNGANDRYRTSYSYKDPILGRQGSGFLGFLSTTTTDLMTNYKTIANMDFLQNNNRLIPFTKSTKGVMPNGDYDLTTYSYTLSSTSTPFWTKLLGVDNINTMRQTHEIKEYAYDNFGNMTLSVSDLNNNAFHSKVESTYAAFGIRNIPNRATSTTATGWRGSATYTTSASFDYDATTAAMTSQINYTNLPITDQLKTSYLYTPFGNVKRKTLTALGGGLTDRYQAYTYDSKGRTAIAMENTLGQTVVQTAEADIDWRYGLPWYRRLLGVQGVYSMSYDNWGRNTLVTTPIGVSQQTTIVWDIRNGLGNDITQADNAIFYTQKTNSNSNNEQVIRYDRLGRPRQATTVGFNGDKVNSVVTYDEKGNRAQATMPFFDNTPPTPNQITTFLYDNLNRPIGQTDGHGTTSISYAFDLTHDIVTTQDYAGLNKVYKKDKAGSLSEITDLNGTLYYYYEADGQPYKISNSSNVLTAMEYDSRRRQIKLFDANAGITTYGYDAFDQLLWQKDNAGNQYELQYYDDGRVKKRFLTGGAEETVYHYVPFGTNGVNKIERIDYHNGYQDIFKYDGYSRLTTKTQNAYFSATTEYRYGTDGRMESMIYPSGYQVNYSYNQYGYLEQVGDGAITHFKAKEMNALGDYTEYVLANGETSKKTYDELGYFTNLQSSSGYNQSNEFDWATSNLTKRSEAAYNNYNQKEEIFQYDANDHERLLQATVSINGIATAPPQTVNYAPNGNISYKTGAGIYAYTDPTKINAVTAILSPEAIGLQNQDVHYTKFKKPETITEGDKLTTITYGADEERRTMTLEQVIAGQPNQPLLSRHYFDNYEITAGRDENGEAIIYETTYIAGGDGLASVMKRAMTWPVGDVVENKLYTIYTDYLGSILVADDIDTRTPRDIDRSFDAWGQLRRPDDWTPMSKQEIQQEIVNDPQVAASWQWLPRGYTGHEHLLEYDLINMNARLYDPTLARMLSPDNLVGDPTNSQAYNRYSYVWNNPLKYTDPTGNDLIGAIGNAIASVISIKYANFYTKCESCPTKWGVSPTAYNMYHTVAPTLSAAVGFQSMSQNTIAAGAESARLADGVKGGGGAINLHIDVYDTNLKYNTYWENRMTAVSDPRFPSKETSENHWGVHVVSFDYTVRVSTSAEGVDYGKSSTDISSDEGWVDKNLAFGVGVKLEPESELDDDEYSYFKVALSFDENGHGVELGFGVEVGGASASVTHTSSVNGGRKMWAQHYRIRKKHIGVTPNIVPELLPKIKGAPISYYRKFWYEPAWYRLGAGPYRNVFINVRPQF